MSNVKDQSSKEAQIQITLKDFDIRSFVIDLAFGL
jgi:hypothetical protein